MLQTFATAFLLFSAYLLGTLSVFPYTKKRRPVFVKAYVISGTVAGTLTFFLMQFFIT